MTCEACDWIQQDHKLYEDPTVVAVLASNPAHLGHIILLPKKHYTILEQVPEPEISHIGIIINKLTIALFESLKIQGTNVFIQNGTAAGQSTPHFMVHIIPRTEGDDINLTWQPRQLSEEEMSTIELKLAEQNRQVTPKQSKPTVNLDEQKNPAPSQDKSHTTNKSTSSKDNYLLKQLERIP